MKPFPQSRWRGCELESKDNPNHPFKLTFPTFIHPWALGGKSSFGFPSFGMKFYLKSIKLWNK
jgi:hypothetical protein